MRVMLSHMRQGLRNSDMHLFASIFYINRVNFSHLNEEPLRDIKTCPRSIFTLNSTEIRTLR